MTLPGTVVIKSTADLTPNGILGYAKALSGFAGLLGGALAVILPLIDPNTTWARYVGGAIAVLGFLGTYQFPNAVKPVEVPPPAVNVEPSADPAPVIPADVLEEPPMVDPLLGVAGPPAVVDVPLPADPPGKHEAD